MNNKKSLLLIIALALVAAACGGGTATPCDEVEITTGENSLLGVVMIATCIVSWAFASIFVSKADLHKSYFVNSGYQMLCGGILLSVFSFSSTYLRASFKYRCTILFKGKAYKLSGFIKAIELLASCSSYNLTSILY